MSGVVHCKANREGDQDAGCRVDGHIPELQGTNHIHLTTHEEPECCICLSSIA